MNVLVPGQGVEDNLHWFFGIVGCLIGFALIGGFVTYRMFKN
jgi:magnesium transporter